MKRPKWYDASVSSVIFKKVQQGELIRGKVHVVPALAKEPRGFGGTWRMDFSGFIDVYVEKSFFDACVRNLAPWALLHLIRHEYTEAKIAVKLARERYPDRNPYVMAEKDVRLGGEAHDLACQELDGLSSQQYAVHLNLEEAILHWSAR